jgi:hypothetical protein
LAGKPGSRDRNSIKSKFLLGIHFRVAGVKTALFRKCNKSSLAMQYKKIKSRRVWYLNIQMSLFFKQILFFGH